MAVLTLSLVAVSPSALAAQPRQRAVHPRFQIEVRQTFKLAGRAVTVPGRPVTVVVLVRPYRPHQRLTVRLVQGSRVLSIQRPWLSSSASGGFGFFKLHLSTQSTGRMRIYVQHQASSQMYAFTHYKKLDVLPEQTGSGARGPFVSLIQQRLAALHFYVPQTGVLDAGTGWAIDAYHRLLGWGTSHTLDQRTIDALLTGTGSFPVRFPNHGRHAEGDLSRQLLALVDGSQVKAILAISSGKPSTPTIQGDFRIYYRVPGYLPDGMYYSDFFHNGYAIHGYNPAPDYPASHGCMRIQIADAIWVYNWLAMGDWVDVYN